MDEGTAVPSFKKAPTTQALLKIGEALDPLTPDAQRRLLTYFWRDEWGDPRRQQNGEHKETV
jgi:hypothetical protein